LSSLGSEYCVIDARSVAHITPFCFNIDRLLLQRHQPLQYRRCVKCENREDQTDSALEQTTVLCFLFRVSRIDVASNQPAQTQTNRCYRTSCECDPEVRCVLALEVELAFHSSQCQHEAAREGVRVMRTNARGSIDRVIELSSYRDRRTRESSRQMDQALPPSSASPGMVAIRACRVSR
jgi:Zn ribbon nucleic-acid-binding protein